jgi:hypothetical protein
LVNHLLYSADSLASSFASRKKKDGQQNNPKIAIEYSAKMMSIQLQQSIFQLLA